MAKQKKLPRTPRLRPSNKPDLRVVDGSYALSTLLRGCLDGRYAITKARNKLEADLVDYAGGKDALTPPVLILIKKVVHKTLITQQVEKLALLGQTELDKTYLAMANSLRLDILALENLLANSRGKRSARLEDYIDQGT